MPDLVRWYDPPDKPIAAKGAVIKTYYGAGRAAMSIKAPRQLLDHLEQHHQLVRRPHPPTWASHQN